MANEKNTGKNAGNVNKNAGIDAAKNTNAIGAGENNANAGTAVAGPKKSIIPTMPTTGTQGSAGGTRISPAAIASMVGKSIKDLTGAAGGRMAKIPGLPKSAGGGRTSNGVKPLLIALFYCVYARWTAFLKSVAWGQVRNVFVDGMPHTIENRILYVVNAAGMVLAEIAFSAVPAWFLENVTDSSVP